MNVPETDISVPMPQIVSNSPTHSLPDISYSGLSTVASLTANQMISAEVPPEDLTTSPSAQQEQTLPTSREFTDTDTVALPALQRAVSTSPRLEHTAIDAQPPEDAGLSRNSSENDVAFFSLAGTSQDADKSVSLSSGCICQQNTSIGDRNNVRASDTALLSGPTSTNGYVSSPSLEHIRSAIRRMMGFASGGSNSENNERCMIARKDSTVSSRSGAGGNRYGSSIFGSKIFESVSTSSFGSQRINVVAESTSIEPVFSGYYSASCDESSFPYEASLLAGRDTRKKPRFRTSSASSDLESSRLSSSGENVTLQRTQSLPSRHASLLPGALSDEVSDSVAELPAAASASSTAKKKWQLTMPELIEGPENDTLTVHGQKREHLAAAALAIIRGEYKESAEGKQMILDERLVTDASELSDVDLPAEKRKYIKNLLVMSASHFFLFSAYFALRNLQSSLNAAGGLGLYALSSVYCSLVFGCLFSTTIVQRLQPKRTMSLCLTGFLLYSAANFYPRFYTMIPASVIHGFFMAVNYTAQSTYLANIASGYADLVGKQMKHVLSQFHGTFFIFLQFSQIAGGLISSLLLSKPSLHGDYVSYAGLTYMNDSNNSSFGDNLYRHSVFGDNTSARCCGSSYCPSDSEDRESNSDIDETTLLVLMGCFGACTVAGCIIVILFLDPLEGVMKKSSAKLSQQMTAVFRFFLHRHACLAVGLSFYSLLQVAFVFGEFTKVVYFSYCVSCCLELTETETQLEGWVN